MSLAHLVREVDVQPGCPGSSPYGCEFGFLLFKRKLAVGASPAAFLSKREKKIVEMMIIITSRSKMSLYFRLSYVAKLKLN